MAFRSASSLNFTPRLVATIDGPPDSGKTHQLLTMPRPLFVFNLDFGLEGLIDSGKFDLDGVEVADYRLDKGMLTKGHAQAAMQKVVKEFVRDYRSILGKYKQRVSIGVDTATEFWQSFRIADLGKLEQVPPMRYTRVNRLFSDLWNEIYQTPHNLLLLHHLKDKYETKVTDDGKEVSVKVPGVERDGYKKLGGIMQVTLRSYAKRKDGKPSTFGFRVVKCRQRSSIEGDTFENDFASFAHLGMSVYPDTDPEDWGMED